MIKRGQIWSSFIPWIITVAVIVLVFFLYMALSGRLEGMGDYFRTFVRFGR